MAFKILKQFIAVDETDPEWAQRDVWVSVLPDGGDINNDKEDIFNTLTEAEIEITSKKDKDKEKKSGKDKEDKFGKKIKDRKYKVKEI